MLALDKVSPQIYAAVYTHPNRAESFAIVVSIHDRIERSKTYSQGRRDHRLFISFVNDRKCAGHPFERLERPF